LWVGKLAAALIGVFFPSRGTNMSGEIACRIMPDLLAGFRGIDPDKTYFITGTNGKSTSNNLVVHAFRTAGRTVATNLEGANQKTGIATTLVKNTTWRGRLKADYLILEVDERNLERVRAAIPARHVAVTNIQKDQVQRNGDPDYIYQKIRRALGPDVTVYVNNEEPRSASLGQYAGRTISFGVARNERASQLRRDDYAQTMACPICHDAIEFQWSNLAGVGRFSCPGCGFASAETPDYQIDSVDYAKRRFGMAGRTYHLGYDAAHFLYNYALCGAVASQAGIDADRLARAYDSFTNVGGRLEEFTYQGKKVRYVRMKQENPETVQSAIDDVAADSTSKTFVVGLQLVHDIIPHYTNTAYFFDCDVEALLSSHVESCVFFGATNSFDAANRMTYAGFPADRIVVVDSDQPRPILDAIAAAPTEQVYLVTMIGMYETLRAAADRKGEK
jgi:UDP-N-acetylmuramyl tripeptide synthase